MAKTPTFDNITAAFASASKLNANFDAIETAFQNTLSRDGSTPNTMAADLDMDSNDILNVSGLNADTIVLGGTLISPSAAAAAETHDFDTQATVAATDISAGFNFVRTSGFAAVGDGGGALYKRGSEPSHAFKINSNSGTVWWELVPDRGVISAITIGIVEGDSSALGAANVTAFNNFIAYAQESDNGENFETYAPTLFFPRGFYHFNAHLNVKAACHIIGESSWGSTGDAGTRLEFPLNTYGFIFHSTDTIDVTTEANTKNAHGSSIQLLLIEGGGNTGTTGSGIWMRQAIRIVDVLVRNFAEDGVRILAKSGGTAAQQGNSNLWYMENVTCEDNGANGLYVNEVDTNVGVCINGNFRANGRWGIRDENSFGNTYIGVHTSGNGLVTSGGNSAGESSHVTFGGVRYSAHIDASEADLVATEPGTDQTVWIQSEGGGSSAGIPTWLAAQSEGTYFHGGSFGTSGNSNNGLFLGCYREGSQGISQVKDPCMVMGGLFGTNMGAAAVQMRGRLWQGRIKFPNHETHFISEPDKTLILLINDDVDALISAQHEDDDVAGFQLLHYKSADGHYIIGKHGTSGSSLPFWVTTDNSTTTGARTSALIGGKALFPQGLWIGSSIANIRQHSNGNAAPSSGEYARGDIVWNKDAAAGGKIGWVCVTTGNPGTWKTFGVIES